MPSSFVYHSGLMQLIAFTNRVKTIAAHWDEPWLNRFVNFFLFLDMETFIVTPKTKAEVKMLTDVLYKMKIASRVLTDKEKEDTGLATIMKEVDRSKKVSKATICKMDHTPNAKTLKTFRDTDRGIGLTRSTSHEDLMKKLDR